MIDYKKLHKEMNDKLMDNVRKHGSIIDEKIKAVLTTYDCKPSQIEIEVHPEFSYVIKIRASEFKFDYTFNVGLNNE